MAKYVSEERLNELWNQCEPGSDYRACINGLIRYECKELNPWMTLEEFLKSGFEGECRIYLRIGYDGIGKFNNNTFSYRYGVIEHESITHVQPIHKPEPPKL